MSSFFRYMDNGGGGGGSGITGGTFMRGENSTCTLLKIGPCGPELIWYQATKFEVSGHHHLPHEK